MAKTKKPKKKSVKKREHRSDIPYGHGVFGVRRGDRGRIELRDVGSIKKLIGDRLFVAFARAFFGAERLDVIAHFLKLNYDHVGYDTVAGERNLWSLAMLSAGALHESVKALNQLSAAGVKREAAESPYWSTLDAMRKKWEIDATLKNVRDGLAHHFGSSGEVYLEGLNKLPSTVRLTVVEVNVTAGGRFPAYPIARELLMPAMWNSNDDFEKFVDAMIADHGAYGVALERLFWEILKKKGVRIPSSVFESE